jgi:hypothetical protein
MVSPANTAFHGMLAVSALSSVRGRQIMPPWSLQRSLHSMPGQMPHLPEVGAGGKLLHLPLSLCPWLHVAQRQWLRLVEKVVTTKL